MEHVILPAANPSVFACLAKHLFLFLSFFFLIQIVILYSCISRVEHSLCLFNSPIQQKSVL